MAIARVTLSCLYGGSVLQNVFHFQKSDYVAGDLPVLLTNFKNLFLDQYKDNMCAEVQILTAHAEELQSGGGGDVADLSLAMVGGGGSDTRVPLQLSMVVQLKTGVAGRRNRGRFFMFGITCNWLLNGIWNPTNLASAQARMDVLVGRWCGTHTTAGWGLVIHGKNDGPSEFRIVQTMVVRSTPGTQRRRQVGVGI